MHRTILARSFRPQDGRIDHVQTTLAERAIRWYTTAARDLPWRRPDATPWSILVSEIMLQQTPVARVLPVYREWLDRWPTPADLAAEPAGVAIQAWGRLGYPRRALRLHECAVAITARHGGSVPRELDELLSLPGVGAYTARAVAAFAYGQRQPVVDTNVRRLVARACLGRADGGRSTTAAELVLVTELLPSAAMRAERASAAFMELGALICTARQPLCDSCPLRRDCAWRLAGRPAAAVLRRGQRYEGTDRQARGVLLALCRQTPRSVSVEAISAAWPDAEQRSRALAGLLEDGLIVDIDGDHYGLPGFPMTS
jgi:A/G-specific adenine glycosylase